MTAFRRRAVSSLPVLVPAAALLALALPRASSGAAAPASLERGTPPPAVAAAASVELDPALRPLRADDVPEGRYLPGRGPFAVTFGEQRVPYRVLAVQALPGETVAVEAPDALTLRHGAGAAAVVGAGRWTWTAPSTPGIVPLVLAGVTGEVRLNVLVLQPASEQRGETLNGYRIGRYLAKPLRGSPLYLPPKGFVAVGEEDADVLLSPHLTLGQFRCKQPGEPRYVHVTTALLVKLEAILELANRSGYDAPTLHVMSGFRTPAYNRSIGNTTVYSRHLWGDAADIWVDADGDGRMDDWSGDGRVDVADARLLLALADQVESEAGVLPGGLGLYKANSAHGPFVHVDARGWAARW